MNKAIRKIRKKSVWQKIVLTMLFVVTFSLAGYFVSSAWFKDEESIEDTLQIGVIELDGNTSRSYSSTINLALVGQQILQDDLTFKIAEDSESIFVRCSVDFQSDPSATLARDILKYTDIPLGENPGYSWSRVGDFYYLVDSETNLPKTIDKGNYTNFSFINGSSYMLPLSINESTHGINDSIMMTINFEAIQGRNLGSSSSSVSAISSLFQTPYPSGPFTVTFKDSDQSSNLSTQTVNAYAGNVASLPNPSAVVNKHFIDKWSTAPNGAGATLTTDNFPSITENITLYPIIVNDYVTVTVNSTEGGTVSPGTCQVVYAGSQEFVVTADAGHSITEITYGVEGIINIDDIKNMVFTLTNLTANVTLNVVFTINSYSFTTMVNGSGSITPTNAVVNYGSNISFTATPVIGWKISEVTIDGVAITGIVSEGALQIINFNNVSSDHIIVVTFEQRVFSINTFAGVNGTISPSNLNVTACSYVALSIVPNLGYKISSIKVDGVERTLTTDAQNGLPQSVIFENVLANHDVSAYFEKQTYTITASASLGGFITPSGVQTVSAYDQFSFTITPNMNKAIDKIIVDGVKISPTVVEGESEIYTFKDIVSNHYISVTFFTVRIILDINGGTGKQPLITYSEDGQQFSLSGSEPNGPTGKDFYYYSTSILSSERGQVGERYDYNMLYDIPDPDGTNRFYAIYLKPTEDVSVVDEYMVYPRGTTSVRSVYDEIAGDNPNELAQGFAAVLALLESNSIVRYITFPSELVNISAIAFPNYTSLKGVSFSSHTLTIEMGAFYGSTAWKSLKLPPIIQTIERIAFAYSGFSSLEFNDVLQTIGETCFSMCDYLTNLTLPASLISADKAFSECSGLVTADLSACSNLTTVSESMFDKCPNLETVILPSTVTSIGRYAFRSCPALKQLGTTSNIIDLSSITAIGDSAFFQCSSISSIIFNTTSSFTISSSAFKECLGLTSVSIPSTLTNASSSIFENCTSIQSVTWASDYSIPQAMFSGCVSLEFINITGAITSIQTEAFKNTGLIAITLPISLTNFQANTFSGCLNLEKIVIQTNLYSSVSTSNTGEGTWYYNGAFYPESYFSNAGTYSIYAGVIDVAPGEPPIWEYVTIGGRNYLTKYNGAETIATAPLYTYDEFGVLQEMYGLKSLNNNVVQGLVLAEGLIEVLDNALVAGSTGVNANLQVLLSSTLEIIGNNAFKGTIIESVILPNLTSLGDSAFENCTAISSISLNPELTAIGNSAFKGAGTAGSGISLTLPAKLLTIGVSAFESSKISGPVYVSSTLTNIGSSAFKSCVSLVTIEGLSNTLITSIPTSCFQDSGLEYIFFPQSLTTISDSAFSGCASLSIIDIKSSVGTIANYAFYNCVSLAKLVLNYTTIPSVTVAATAFSGTENILNVYVPSSSTRTNYASVFNGKGFKNATATVLGARMFYNATDVVIAEYYNNQWQEVFEVSIKISEYGSAEDNYNPSTTYAELTTTKKYIRTGFGLVLSLSPVPGRSVTGVYLDGVYQDGTEGLASYSKSISSKCLIYVVFVRVFITLDKNGGDYPTPLGITYDDASNPSMFTISSSTIPTRNAGEEFYFWSTNSNDNESNQSGIRFDVGIQYSFASLNGETTLYAIYLTPSDVAWTFSSGTISISDKTRAYSNIVIPNKISGVNVTAIAANGFTKHTGTSEVTASQSLITGQLTLPRTVTQIGDYAFAGNTGLNKQISFPSNISAFGTAAFALTSSLPLFAYVQPVGKTSPVIDRGVIIIGSTLYAYPAGRPGDIVNGKTTFVPTNPISTYAAYAFAGSNLQALSDNDGTLTSIGAYCFYNMLGLELMTFIRTTPPSMGVNAFKGTPETLRVEIPSSFTATYIPALNNKGFANDTFMFENSVVVPTAQYYSNVWKRIFKLTSSTTGGGTIIAVCDNKYLQYSNYYREDWEIELRFVPSTGKKLKSVTIAGVPLDLSGIVRRNGEIYSHNLYLSSNIIVIAVFENRIIDVRVSLTSTSSGSLTINTGTTKIITQGQTEDLVINHNTTISFKMYPTTPYIANYIKITQLNTTGNYVDFSNLSGSTTTTIYLDSNAYIMQNAIYDYIIEVDYVYSPIRLQRGEGTWAQVSNKNILPTITYSGRTDSSTFKINTDNTPNGPDGKVFYYYANLSGANNTYRIDVDVEYTFLSIFGSGSASRTHELVAKYFIPMSSSDYSYSSNDDGSTVRLKNGVVYGVVAVPKVVNNKPVIKVERETQGESTSFISIRDIILPSTVTEVGDYTFTGVTVDNSSINDKVYLPTNLATIGIAAFAGITADGLYSTVSKATNNAFVNGLLYNSSRTAILSYPHNISFNTSYYTGVTEIGPFVYAKSLATALVVPTSITTFGNYCFYNSMLKTFDFNGKTTPQTFGANSFNGTGIIEFVALSNFSSFEEALTGKGIAYNSLLENELYSSTPHSAYLKNSVTNVGIWRPFHTLTLTKSEDYGAANDGNIIVIDECKDMIYQGDTYNVLTRMTISGNTYEYYVAGEITLKASSATYNYQLYYFNYDSVDMLNAFPEGDSNFINSSKGQYETNEVSEVYNFCEAKVVVHADAIVTSKYRVAFTTLDFRVYRVNAYDGTSSIAGYSVGGIIEDKVTISGDNITNGTMKFIPCNTNAFAFTITPNSGYVVVYVSTVFSVKIVEQGVERTIEQTSTLVSQASAYDRTIGYNNHSIFIDGNSILMEKDGVCNIYILYCPILLNANGGNINASTDDLKARTMLRMVTHYSDNFIINNASDNLNVNNENEFYYFSSSSNSQDQNERRYDENLAYPNPTSEGGYTMLYARYFSPTISGITLSLNKRQLTRCTSTDSTIVVPYGVTSIRAGAFSNYHEYIYFPSTLKYIYGEYENNGNTPTMRVKACQLPGGIEFIEYGSIQAKERVYYNRIIHARYSAELRNSENVLESNYYGVLYDDTILHTHPKELQLNKNNFNVYEIGPLACLGNTAGGSLNIPRVKGVGRSAFEASAISSVAFGNSLSSIGIKAFYGCESLTFFINGSGITYISRWAFGNNTSLRTVNFGSNIREIGDYAFSGCSQLSNVVNAFPTSLYSIGEGAFENTSALIVELENLSNIGKWSFKNSGITEFSFYRNPYRIPEGAFYGCTNLEDLFEMFENVEYIDDWAFCDCSSLLYISFGASVKSIGYYSFGNTSAVELIYFAGETPPSISSNAFSGSSSSVEVWITSCDYFDDYKSALDYKGFSNGATMSAFDYSRGNTTGYEYYLARHHGGQWRRIVYVLTYRNYEVSRGYISISAQSPGAYIVQISEQKEYVFMVGTIVRKRYELLQGYSYKFEYKTGTIKGKPLASWVDRSIDTFDDFCYKSADDRFEQYDQGSLIRSSPYKKGSDFSGNTLSVSYIILTMTQQSLYAKGLST